MAFFPDLSPYAYGNDVQPGVVHVGWLDGVHPFPKGAVDRRLVEKLRILAKKPVELYRGYHLCELCKEPPGLQQTLIPNHVVIDPDCSWARWVDQRSSNGEIRLRFGSVTYAAPVLIAHYISEHGYLPPADFLKAIEQADC